MVYNKQKRHESQSTEAQKNLMVKGKIRTSSHGRVERMLLPVSMGSPGQKRVRFCV